MKKMFRRSSKRVQKDQTGRPGGEGVRQELLTKDFGCLRRRSRYHRVSLTRPEWIRKKEEEREKEFLIDEGGRVW